MTTSIEAVYDGGVFRPTRQVALADGTHVEVLVPTANANRDPRTVAARLAEVAARADRKGEVESTSRDHDRYLYVAEPKS
ncbi:MAG: antitoxin family protein [Planctomycetaceae bacterium]|nr:antitoxin family protein [Planctomycetaceae bacterium]